MSKKMKVFTLALAVMMAISSIAFAYANMYEKYSTVDLRRGHGTGHQSSSTAWLRPYIANVQEDINNAGKGISCGTADGKFGSNTEKGVKKYQVAVGLKGDGIVGDRTKTALWEGW